MVRIKVKLWVGARCSADNKNRDVKQSSNFRTSVLKFEFKFDLHIFGIRISD